MNYYDEIKNKLIDNEIYGKVKDYSKEKHKVITYFEIGRLLDEAGKHYGEGIVKEYSTKLTKEFGRNYTPSLLYKIKQFYYIYEKVPTMSGNLTWSHWYELLSIKDVNKIKYYVIQCESCKLDVRSLRKRIKNKEYERLDDKTKLKLINKEEPKVEDLVKNPILIKNINDYEVVSEKVLPKIIIEDIENFMKELGNSFCFIGSEYKIKIGNTYNYIDLLLYNIEYNCYIVIELKITELKKDHIGQIQVYMNYIDKNLKKINQDKTIGIIICKKDNKYIIEYCSDNRIVAKEYELI